MHKILNTFQNLIWLSGSPRFLRRVQRDSRLHTVNSFSETWRHPLIFVFLNEKHFIKARLQIQIQFSYERDSVKRALSWEISGGFWIWACHYTILTYQNYNWHDHLRRQYYCCYAYLNQNCLYFMDDIALNIYWLQYKHLKRYPCIPERVIPRTLWEWHRREDRARDLI